MMVLNHLIHSWINNLAKRKSIRVLQEMREEKILDKTLEVSHKIQDMVKTNPKGIMKEIKEDQIIMARMHLVISMALMVEITTTMQEI